MLWSDVYCNQCAGFKEGMCLNDDQYVGTVLEKRQKWVLWQMQKLPIHLSDTVCVIS